MNCVAERRSTPNPHIAPAAIRPQPAPALGPVLLAASRTMMAKARNQLAGWQVWAHRKGRQSRSPKEFPFGVIPVRASHFNLACGAILFALPADSPAADVTFRTEQECHQGKNVENHTGGCHDDRIRQPEGLR
jgi:hypothetical protein